MQFRFGIILIVAALIEKTLQICIVINNFRRTYPLQYNRFEPIYHRPRIGRSYPLPLPPGLKKYIQCQDEPLSADFHTKIESLKDGAPIEWLEINNTNSPEIAAEAFKNLQMIPDLRINGANVQVIQAGAFNGLFHLSQLSLKNNMISSLKEHYFNNLSNLVEIDLSLNNIADIDQKTFAGLQKLQRLYLGNNLITSLPSGIFKEQINMDTLDLSFNKLVEIDDRLFKNLSKLSNLWVNDNHLNSISNILLSNNLQLSNLYINNNYLTTLNNFTLPKSLNTINGSQNLLHHLSFASFTVIKIIDLSKNGMTELNSDTFKNLAVGELYLDTNYFGVNSIPAQTFNNLSDLEIISLSNNQIRQLTQNLLKNNKKLRKLNLAKNYLGPGGLSDLPTSLEDINLMSNNFGSSLNLTYLTKLRFLDISFNNLTFITFNFFDGLKTLLILNLQNNKITQINVGCFRELKALRGLDLSNNNITVLEIGVFVGLDYLQNLDISHNKLNVLSEGVFHNLKSLQVLKFGHNNITFFSVENTLSHLTWLREIDLSGNRWTCSLLTSLIKDFRRLKLTDGGNYNVTNINGVACRSELKDSTDINNAQLKYIDTVSSKLTTNNNLLIFIIIILLVKLMLKYIHVCMRRARTLMTREKSEQELQLI